MAEIRCSPEYQIWTFTFWRYRQISPRMTLFPLFFNTYKPFEKNKVLGVVKKDWWASGYFWSHTSGLVKTKFVKQRWFVFISFSLSLSFFFFFFSKFGWLPQWYGRTDILICLCWNVFVLPFSLREKALA